MVLNKINHVHSWYKLIGQILIALGVVATLLWGIRFTIFKSSQFIRGYDDILTLAVFFILLIPNGIWFRYIGTRFEKYNRVSLFPAILIFITPMIITIFSLSFLPFRYNPFQIVIWSLFKFLGVIHAGQLVMISSVIICVVTFVLGNVLLKVQTLRSNEVSRTSR
jgi:hypothetical protein